MAKGRIEINKELCKGCEFCTMVCPYNLIEIADYYNSKSYRPALFVDPEQRCTGCMLCGMICPEAGITVFREVRVNPVVRQPPIPSVATSR